MIVGNDSGLKMAILVALLVLATMTFIATLLAPDFWWIAGTLNAGLYVKVIVKLYKRWENNTGW